MRAYLLSVEGEVQGVFYRHHAQKKAKEFNLSGWIKNEHDGTVSLFIEGEEDSLKKMISWAKEGSPMATVEEVRIDEAEPTEKRGFEVK
jgi:acylphosphatase